MKESLATGNSYCLNYFFYFNNDIYKNVIFYGYCEHCYDGYLLKDKFSGVFYCSNCFKEQKQKDQQQI